MTTDWMNQELLSLTRATTSVAAQITSLSERMRHYDQRMARLETATATHKDLEDRLETLEEQWANLHRLVRWGITLGSMAIALLPALKPDKAAELIVALIGMAGGQ